MPIVVVIVVVVLGVGLETYGEGKLSFKHKFLIWFGGTCLSCAITAQLNADKCSERIEKVRERARENARESIMGDLAMQDLREQRDKLIQRITTSKIGIRVQSIVRIYDGNTIKVNLKCDDNVFCRDLLIRVKGIDTPQLKASNRCEKIKAKQAYDLTKSFLQGANIELRNCVSDKIRFFCDVYSNGRNLADELVKQNLAYPSNGGTDAKVDYCK